MLIGKTHKIESDSDNVVLFRKVIAKKKESGEKYERWQVMGYYNSAKNALHDLIEREIKGTGLTDFTNVVAKIEELHKLIDSLKMDAT